MLSHCDLCPSPMGSACKLRRLSIVSKSAVGSIPGFRPEGQTRDHTRRLEVTLVLQLGHTFVFH